ncbi:MAG: phage portal protein [Christensenellaceae bacterium]
MIRINDIESLTTSRLRKIINRHMRRRERLQRALDMYLNGAPPIKTNVAKGRANNVVNTNLAKYIVDVATGYFVGTPPKYSFDKEAEEIGAAIQATYDANDETNLNYTIAENMSIYGVGYDIVRFDEEGRLRITALDPRDVFMIYDNTIDERVLAAGRVYFILNENDITDIYLDLYTADVMTTYRITGGALEYVSETELYFGAVPITEYRNGAHCAGDFEAVKENIRQYNLALSNMSDDLHSTANAFLALTGLEDTDQEKIDRMNENRVVLLPYENASAYYVTKTLDATASENHKTTLRRDILQVAGVPDLSDESFAGNASGVALEYKLWGLDQLRTKKQQGMDKGLFNRLKLVAAGLRVKGQNAPENISEFTTIAYTRNMPRDKTTDIDAAVKLNGIVSDNTIFKLLEPVTGVTVADETEKASAIFDVNEKS